MEEKILAIKERYDTVLQQLNDPEIISNNDVFRELSKELTQLEPIVQLGDAFIHTLQALDANKELLDQSIDSELKSLA
jgi:peptide chain release factor 1